MALLCCHEGHLCPVIISWMASGKSCPNLASFSGCFSFSFFYFGVNIQLRSVDSQL